MNYVRVITLYPGKMAAPERSPQRGFGSQCLWKEKNRQSAPGKVPLTLRWESGGGGSGDLSAMYGMWYCDSHCHHWESCDGIRVLYGLSAGKEYIDLIIIVLVYRIQVKSCTRVFSMGDWMWQWKSLCLSGNWSHHLDITRTWGRSARFVMRLL